MDYVVSKVLIDLYKNMENNEIFKDETISLDKLLDIVKKYMEKQNPVYSVIEQTTLKTSVITKTYYPKGTFKVYIEHNDIYASLEIMISLMMTRNKGIFIVDENVPIINSLIKIINKLTEKEIFSINDNISFFDEILCIGTKKFYNEILNFSYKDIIYFGYGEYDVYLTEQFENKQEKIKDEPNYNIYMNISLAEALVRINEFGSNFTSAIFTKDENEVKYFLEKCNSKNIYINMLPSKKCYLDLDLNNFVKIKNIIISK